jgi:Flp pilus assembly pilin Flp
MKNLWTRLKALHRDEQGADMVEYILIVAAIALPLMGVVIYFWKSISTKASEWWDAIKGGAGQNPNADNDPHNF